MNNLIFRYIGPADGLLEALSANADKIDKVLTHRLRRLTAMNALTLGDVLTQPHLYPCWLDIIRKELILWVGCCVF